MTKQRSFLAVVTSVGLVPAVQRQGDTCPRQRRADRLFTYEQVFGTEQAGRAGPPSDLFAPLPTIRRQRAHG